MRDSNVDLLKYTTGASTAQFLDQIYSPSLLPQITSPAHISTKSKTLIANFFSTDSPEEPIFGNTITYVSDLTQFLLFSIEKSKGSKKKKFMKEISKALQEMN